MPADQESRCDGDRTGRANALHLVSHGTQNANPDLPHILLVVDGFPRSLGGGERVVLRMAALLPSYGFRASILTFFLDPHSSFQPKDSPCPLYLLPLTKTYNLQALRGAIALRRLIREERVILVQTFFESSDLWAGAVTRFLTSAKLVWSRRDMGILRGRKHVLAYRLASRLPHGLQAVSERVRLHSIQTDGIAPQRTWTIHNGLDLEPLPSPKAPRERTGPVVLSIGNIRHVKGHDILIEAAARVHTFMPEVRFRIVGAVLEPEFFKRLCASVHALGLREVVTFTGRVQNPTSELQDADIFVLPSRSEGFSNSLIEAMAAKLPVIATTVGGNEEAIVAGETGLLVAPEDTSALADALLSLLRNAERRQCMGLQGRERAMSCFSANAMMRALTASYCDILAGK